jgi:tetratricopeptide (TPR) repeat protein
MRPFGDAAICCSIFLLAYLVRLIYLFQIESIPVFYNLPGDPRAYDEWAQRIAAGDWIGRGVFYQAPLYPYFLAVLELIFGHDLWAVRVVQLTLSAAAASLLYLAGKAFFSRAVGIAAALIWTFNAPAIFFSGLVDKTVIDPFLLAALLVLLSSASEHFQRTMWIAIGAVLGLSALSRENTLIWAFLIPAWIWLGLSNVPGLRRLQYSALFLLGLALVLLPVGVRNLKVGGQFTLTTSQMGANFFIGNNPRADGTYASIRGITGEKQFEQPEATRLAEQALGHNLSPGEVSKYWLARSWDYIRSSPSDWLRLMWRKWLIVWNVREIEDSDDFYLYQRWSWLLSFLAWINHFGVIAPLAAVGCLVTWRQWRRLWLLYAMLAAFAGSVALFYIFGRYRFPLVPLLTLFAGAGVVHGYDLFKEKRSRELVECAVALLVVGSVVWWPVVGKPGPSAPGYTYLANGYAKEGLTVEAIRSAQEALKIDPTYGVAHYNLANLYAESGRLDDAVQHYREAIRVYPRFVEARGNLANALAMRGNLPEAIAQYSEALKLSPVQSRIHYGLGNVLALERRLDEAIEHFNQALKIDPNFAQAHNDLGRVLAARGDLEGAIQHFREAVHLDPNFAKARENLTIALAEQAKNDQSPERHRQ